jgi:TolB-like protein/tetratricopeptide (TPR) repeat protein
MRLFVEIQRRGILKVATGYLIVSWLVLEVGHTLFNVFELPHAGLQFVFVLLALGFPVALLGAWQGWFGTSLQRDPHAAAGVGEGHTGVSHHEGPWLAAVFGVVALFAVAVAIGVRFFGMGHSVSHGEHDSAALTSAASTAAQATAGAPHPASAPVNEKSIAVLPFTDMSEKKDQEYFADGMAEEVLDLLTKVPGVRVIGRTSSFQFKGKSGDLRTISQTLGAIYVVEGSVRKSGDRLRVTAQLIGAADGSHLWSQTYDEKSGDVLGIQDRIAAGIVRALQVTVGADGLQDRPALKSADAYDLYLRGRHEMDRFDKTGFETAAGYFQQALEIDPSLVRAAEWLAAAQEFMAEWGFVPVREGYEVTRASLERALKLDPRSGLAHSLMCTVHAIYDWDSTAAVKECRVALALEPRNPQVLGYAGQIQAVVGHWDEAARLTTASIALDPLFAGWHDLLAIICDRTGHVTEAEVERRRTLDISPTYERAHFDLGLTLLAEGKLDATLAEMQEETPDGGRDAGLAIIYNATGRKVDSDDALARFSKEHATDRAYRIAQIHAYRGDANAAFVWLDRAYDQKDVDLLWFKGNLAFRAFETDPRYRAFLSKMNLPE